MKLALIAIAALIAAAAACGSEAPATDSAAMGKEESQAVAGAAPAAPPQPSNASRQRGTVGLTTGEGAADMARRTDPSANAGSSVQFGAGDPSAVPSMIIKTGHVSLEVDSLEPALADLRQVAQRVGGFVANMSIQGGQEQTRSAMAEIRIPAARFDDAMSGIVAAGKLEGSNVSSEDVGEEFVDMTARMKNARRLEERLIELLATRTGKLSDVLTVERELARIREEIERYEGRLRYLRTRASVSSITVNLHEPRPILGSQPGRNPIVEAFRRAWRNFVQFVASVISMLGVLVPLAAIGAIAWVLVRRWFPNLFGASRDRAERHARPPEPRDGEHR